MPKKTKKKKIDLIFFLVADKEKSFKTSVEHIFIATKNFILFFYFYLTKKKKYYLLVKNNIITDTYQEIIVIANVEKIKKNLNVPIRSCIKNVAVLVKKRRYHCWCECRYLLTATCTSGKPSSVGIRAMW